ncbi:nuclear pore complex protein Nup153 isoform X11 [Cygnus olor]|uniref:nuclear pore complex protein Nup153 isoform X11 n=1 Tax=Cygnus olor TaxID=8869 RepID=UPI001ADE5897|nr:nuclear pore complex protein Nup153 isoform X11 [Cygnus olor]
MASGGATGSGVNGSGMAGGGMAGSDGASGGSPGAGSGAGGGGGAAGGKMKSRRQHLGAAKPPYARSKQQGIISRMTETVKNIVPAWLQKYFNKREEECADGNESANQEETPVNYHHDYADEDTIIDERFTPEPARINRQEPSTSRSALNFPVVLTRPSLHRSHLNYPMLDSPVPPCQPSTSSIFGIGSPGLSFIKEIKDSTSQQDDDNISTTSGFSSRASDKDVAVLKNTSSSLLWPTEAERTHSLSQHSAASSKKPAFSLSVFGGLCPARGSTSFCKQNQLGFSPFYPGKTAYGGAAVRSKQPKTEPYRAQKRAKARQETVRSPATLSTAARCILEAMEKLSSPLLDAKRMASLLPLYCPPDIDKLDITDFQSKRRKLESQNASQHPPVKRLVTPKVNPQSMLYARYPKPSPTATTQSSKIRQRVDTKYQGMREKTLPAEQQAEPSESNVTSYKFNTAASNGLSSGMSSGGGKMRRERGMHYLSRAVQEQEVEEPVLPKIPLPIATASLPQFNFSFVDSSAVSASPSTVSTAAMSMATPAAATGVANPAAARGVAIPAAATGVATPAAAMGMATPAAATGMATPAEAKGMGNPAEATGMDNRVAVTGIARTAGATGTGNGEAATGMENHKAAAGTGNPAAATGAGNPAVAPAAGMACPSEVEGMACPSEVEGMACPSEVEGMTDPSEVEDLTDLSEEEVEDMTYSMATAGITYSTVSSGLTYPVVAPGTPSLMMTKGKAKSTAATTSMANSTAAAGKIQPTSNVSSPEFAFSSPIVKSTEAEVLPTFSQIGFTFSVPVVKSAELSGSSGTPVTSFLTLDTTTSTNTNTQKEEVEDFVGGPFTTAHVLKEGSVLDILKNPDFGFLKTHSSTSVQPTTSTVVYTRPAITTFSAGKETSKQASYWQSDTRDPFLQNKDINNKCVTCQSTKASTVESMKQTVSSSQCDTSKPAAPPAGMLGFGDKFKTVPGTWDCDTCLVQNKPEATKCIACETPKPGTGVMPALTLPVVTDSSVTVTSSSSSTDTTATLGFGDKFKKPKGSWDCGICLVSNKTEDNKCVACQSEKPEGPTPVTSSSASAFSAPSGEFLDLDKFKKPEGSWDCETCLVRNKAEATKCVACESAKPGTKAELKGFGTATASTNAALPSFTFGVQPSSSSESSSAESVAASQFILGRTEEKQDSVTSAAPLVFGKKADTEESKTQPIFSVGKSEHTKEESTAKPIFNFSFVKPSEKEPEQAKPAFSFGVQTSTSDQGAAKPSFSFLSSGSSSTAIPTTSANSSSVFGSVTSSSNPMPVPAPFVFGQASNTVSSSTFGNSAEFTTSQSFGFSQENKPATTSSSTGVAVAPFVFGSGASSSNAANPGFTFGATTTSSSTGLSSSFVFGSGSPAPAAGPAFGASQPPAFGQSQGSSQPNTPSFGSLSTTLFSAGSQPAPPAFGSVTSSTQPPVFGQQASQQPGFGSGTSSAGPVFQFGSNTSNFNFPNNPGVFTFGANPTAPTASAQPSGSSGFSFSQPPAFTVGTNGKNIFSASGSSVSGRKIKTAVRRRK